MKMYKRILLLLGLSVLYMTSLMSLFNNAWGSSALYVVSWGILVISVVAFFYVAFFQKTKPVVSEKKRVWLMKIILIVSILVLSTSLVYLWLHRNEPWSELLSTVGFIPTYIFLFIGAILGLREKAKE